MSDSGTTVVSPELMRTSQQHIESALQTATAIANEYLSSHEDIVNVVSWSGKAGTTSLATAGQIEHDLQQIIAGGQRLAHGLGRASLLMEQHEDDAAHGIAGLFDSGNQAL
ncbi:WXG100 family type VII secretion target [Mycobacterium haemophilum]|uniref:Type VII secretion protein EsxD n=1 Tax=Mycobacterium haemophilum TaxID=29311 RepID=A0A0I9U0H7_9MYCO|nr:WXG100 family type VII secretion target [Mycobacterium haemophilum]KLO28620.1 hypothetical protein ABH39_13590 [Mycobacterium haemophilum]KLO35531.1 hypothetical protein ABH38_15715 [Mycobacterium haemophilum]KLO40766.1 hypothetical protein ABH37_15445 [Mycobacterium haemophilum]KLO48120.1 hypothetical protein ABH36_14535 [Mycobacterium haemophilum]